MYSPQEKLETLSFFLKSFGYKLQTENKKSIAQSMNKILMDVKGKEEASMVETLTIMISLLLATL
ncbi:hypothetical protein N9Y89_00560 [bacterium]|nr:hypothetical protein [bacterium]